MKVKAALTRWRFLVPESEVEHMCYSFHHTNIMPEPLLAATILWLPIHHSGWKKKGNHLKNVHVNMNIAGNM